MCGDFNEVVSPFEKFGGNPVNDNQIDAFLDCIRDLEMHDLGFTGFRFIWTNNIIFTTSLIMERSDRFLANSDWLHLFQDSSVHHLPRIHSDHCPILLNLARATRHPSPSFRYETMWTNHPSFALLVNTI